MGAGEGIGEAHAVGHREGTWLQLLLLLELKLLIGLRLLVLMRLKLVHVLALWLLLRLRLLRLLLLLL